MSSTSRAKYGVVGCGFTGAVIANRLASLLDERIVVMDRRPHLGGNCYTQEDPLSGVTIHTYGPHIFHTSDAAVWDFVNSFGEFRVWINRVKACTVRGVFSFPINLHTINQFYGATFSPAEAAAFLAARRPNSVNEPRNFEELAIATLGQDLYSTFIFGYTKKQWGCDPASIPCSVFRRLPFRLDYDDNYYCDRYQGIPVDGYTAVIKNMLSDERISVELSTTVDAGICNEFDHVFYSGPIDEFFCYSAGKLGYRGLRWKRIDASGDFQGVAVMNYPELAQPFTRISEHKHFTPWRNHRTTVAFEEFSFEATASSDCYYPKRLPGDLEVLARYVELAEREPNITFIGRLGTYRYLDMNIVIADALRLADAFCDWTRMDPRKRQAFPSFWNSSNS